MILSATKTIIKLQVLSVKSSNTVFWLTPTDNLWMRPILVFILRNLLAEPSILLAETQSTCRSSIYLPELNLLAIWKKLLAGAQSTCRSAQSTCRSAIYLPERSIYLPECSIYLPECSIYLLKLAKIHIYLLHDKCWAMQRVFHSERIRLAAKRNADLKKT